MDAFYRNRTRPRALTLLGFLLLAVWAAWWAVSVSQDRLACGRLTWIPCCPNLGCDFEINYFGCKTWLAGGDPYQSYARGARTSKYDHPPPVLVLFSPTNLLSREAAQLAWFGLQFAIAILAAAVCGRTRRDLGLTPLPTTLVVAAYLFSMPLLFELERGNWNSLIVALGLTAAWALREKTFRRDLLAGGCVALAAWIKMYPGLLVFGLLALRRGRAAGACAAFALAIGLAGLPYLNEFRANIRESAESYNPDLVGQFLSFSHTLGGSWRIFCKALHVPFLADLPPAVGWLLVIGPAVGWVSVAVGRAARPGPLLVPYFLWLLAAATYLPSIACDYNLLFLPLASLAVWDRRDPRPLHLLMTALLLVLQPVALPLPAEFVWFAKLIGLGAVAACLVNRAREQAWESLGEPSCVSNRVLPPRGVTPVSKRKGLLASFGSIRHS